MSVVSLFLVIFDTGDTYSCSSYKGDFLKLEEKMFPRNIKVMAKRLDTYGFGIDEYFVRS